MTPEREREREREREMAILCRVYFIVNTASGCECRNADCTFVLIAANSITAVGELESSKARGIFLSEN